MEQNIPKMSLYYSVITILVSQYVCTNRCTAKLLFYACFTVCIPVGPV
jgi:hypothetical protein